MKIKKIEYAVTGLITSEIIDKINELVDAHNAKEPKEKEVCPECGGNICPFIHNGERLTCGKLAQPLSEPISRERLIKIIETKTSQFKSREIADAILIDLRNSKI